MLECEHCNREPKAKFYKLKEQILKGEVSKSSWEGEKYVPMYTEFIRRDLILDLPENLVITLKRYQAVMRVPSKLHTPVKLEESLWLDECIIHRVQKMKKVPYSEMKAAKSSKKFLYTL